MEIECRHCLALKWKGETPGICCSGGKVNLPPFKDPPEPLKTYLSKQTGDANSKHFLKTIRQYNCAIQMTSFGANIIRQQGY